MGQEYSIDGEASLRKDVLAILQNAAKCYSLRNHSSLQSAVADEDVDSAREALLRIAEATKYLPRLSSHPMARSAWTARDVLGQLDTCFATWALSV